MRWPFRARMKGGPSGPAAIAPVSSEVERDAADEGDGAHHQGEVDAVPDREAVFGQLAPRTEPAAVRR